MMDFLKSIAPWIGAAVGGPPALIAMAAKELSDALGYDVPADSQSINSAVSGATQEQLIKIKELDAQFSSKMQELGFDTVDSLVKSEVADKASARDMQVEALKQDGWLAKNFVYLLASFWTVATIIYIGFITFGSIPAANARFADTILGFLLGTVIATIINFFMGTSFSSRIKDESINKLSGGK
jgi:hypothetical protein